MSQSTTPQRNCTDLPDDHRERPTLTTIVTRTLPHDTMPYWNEYQTAAWAVGDTIRRVAPEART